MDEREERKRRVEGGMTKVGEERVIKDVDERGMEGGGG